MKLFELRKQKAKSQAEVAKAINVSQVAYSKYETGKSEPSNDILAKLADYFGVTIDYLLGREPILTIPEEFSTELTSIIEKYVQWKRENDIPKNFLFGGENFISKNILDRNLAKYMEKTDIEKHITPHCFRHSFVSMLIDIGYNSKMVAEMIDDTEEMVIKTYGHLYAAKKHEIISGVNEHLRKNLGTSLGTKLYQMAIIDVETR